MPSLLRHVHKAAKTGRPCARIYQLGSHWKDIVKFDIRDFNENLPKKYKKSDKNSGHFSWKPNYIYILSFVSCIAI